MSRSINCRSFSNGGSAICTKHNAVQDIVKDIQKLVSSIEKYIEHPESVQDDASKIETLSSDIYDIIEAALEDGQNMEDGLKKKNDIIDELRSELEEANAKIQELESLV